MEAVLTYGEFDLVVRIEVKSIESLEQFIFNTFRNIKGIDEVTSLITARAHLGW
jgi:DNA-binding Lrp family transcriptional regulator